MKRRVLACLTALVMAINMIPSSAMSAYAGETDQPPAVEETVPEEEEESVQDSGESDSKEQAVEDSSDGGGETGTVKEAAPEEGADESEEAVTDEKSDAAESDSDEADADLAEDQGFETEPGASDTEATTAAAEEIPATRTEYDYSDSNVSVKVTLQKADAVPDDADLVVTRVTDRTDGYNYDAYMDALNDQAEDGKEYTSDNTLLYDIAFMYEEKDAEGNGTGKVIEYQPESGSVKINISFKDGQLNEQISAEKADDVEILHLPLTDSVRNSVDTTADATDIDKNDINVESVQDEKINVNGESASFSVSGLSLIALSAPKRAASGGDSVTGTISFFDEHGTNKAPFTPADDDDYFVLVTIKAKEGEDAGKTVGWGIKQISKAEISERQEYNFSVDEFYDFGEDGSSKDVPFVYNTDDYDISVRFYHTATPVENYQEAVAASDVIDGYSFMGSKYGPNASDSYHNPAKINLIKKTLGAKFYVQISADDIGDVSAGGDYWIAVKARRENGYSYHCEQFTINAGDFDAHKKIDIPITVWTTEDGDVQQQQFSDNWSEFEVLIAARKPEQKDAPMNPKRIIGGDAQNFVNPVVEGDLVGAFKVKKYTGVTPDSKTTDELGNIEWRYLSTNPNSAFSLLSFLVFDISFITIILLTN